MTQSVTMPDGSVNEFPDEATPEQITSALGGGAAAPQPPKQPTMQATPAMQQRVQGMQPPTAQPQPPVQSSSAPAPQQPPQAAAPQQAPQPQPAPQQPQERGLMENLAQDVKNRFNTGVGIMSAPNQNPAMVGLKMAGKVAAGTATDIAGDVAKAAYGAAPDVGGWKEKVSDGIQQAMDSPLGKAGLEAAKKGALEYVGWARDNPKKADAIESLVDIASFFPVGKAVGAAGKVAGEAAAVATKPIPVLGPLVKGARSESYRDINTAANAAKMEEYNKINKAKLSKVSINPKPLNDMSTNLGKVVNVDNDVEKRAAPQTLQTIQALQNNITTGKVSLNDIVSTRNKLSEAQAMGGEEAQYARKAKDVLDKHLTEIANKKQVSGSAEDIKNYQTANKEYGKAKQYENIVNAINAGGDSTSKMRSGVRKLIDDTATFNSYPAAVKSALLKMEKGKTSANIINGAQELIDALPLGFGKFGHFLTSKVIGKSADVITRGHMVGGMKKIKNAIQGE